jgi:putative phosphoesterase
MRLALIADIHGNILALDAVLAELRDERYDHLLCLGDVAVGPQPAEAVERVRELGCRVVMGNWDAYFLDGFPEYESDLGRRLVEMGRWWAEQLGAQHREFMRAFESQVELDGVLAVHGSPRSYEDFIYPTTPDDEVDRMLDGSRAPVLAGGHTHFQMVRRLGATMLVNPGSVGLPFSRPAPVMQIEPWAEYGFVSLEDGRLGVELRRTAFDVGAFVRLVRESGMPHADWWAGLWIGRG